MTDLATRIETTPWTDALNEEVARFLGWVSDTDNTFWWKTPIETTCQLGSPNFTSLDTIAVHTPDGWLWQATQFDDNWHASLRHSFFYRMYCFGDAPTEAAARLAALVRAVEADRVAQHEEQ